MPAPVALLAFAGSTVTDDIARRLADPAVAGVTLFRHLNIVDAAQTRRLTQDLVTVAGRPILVAIDQEGGQLIGAGSFTTQFAGNMALGATADADLAYRVGAAIGRELRALGVNVNYAPVADVASNPQNPSLGIRSFGEDPSAVSKLVAATVGGLQSQGVAATLKHFPGKGEAAVDPHYQLPRLDLDRAHLEEIEFPPFRAGIQAGAQLVMVGHYAIPAITDHSDLPTTASARALQDVLRGDLEFKGLIVTDALDMGGFSGTTERQCLAAGVDLLLYGPAQAEATPPAVKGAPSRLAFLLSWLERFPEQELSVVGSTAHRDLAAELATRSVTLVRDTAAILPLQPRANDRILLVVTRPDNVTPADTSAEVRLDLAAALRKRHSSVSEIVLEKDPTPTDTESVLAAAQDHSLIIVATDQPGPGHVRIIDRLADRGAALVTVALRTPYDLAAYPGVRTHLTTYGIHQPSMEALAGGLFGEFTFSGRLPVAIPGLYPVGHRWPA